MIKMWKNLFKKYILKFDELKQKIVKQIYNNNINQPPANHPK